MDKILISACLLGENVRYNAKPKGLLNPLIEQWKNEKRLYPVCPEVCGGLPIPRAPAEMNQASQKVINSHGEDVTYAFNIGAKNALRICVEHNIRFALLKESSPSCGSQTIYDGSFTQTKISGVGVTTKLLQEHGIQVFSEDNLAELVAALTC